MLGEGGAHEQPAVAAAGDGQLFGPGVPGGDHQPAGGVEVVEDVLLVGEVALLVPLIAVFAAAADVGLGEDNALLDEDAGRGAEIGRDIDAIAAVAGHDAGMGAVEEEAFLPDDVHRHAGAVLRNGELPDDLAVGIVDGRFHGDGGFDRRARERVEGHPGRAVDVAAVEEEHLVAAGRLRHDGIHRADGELPRRRRRMALRIEDAQFARAPDLVGRVDQVRRRDQVARVLVPELRDEGIRALRDDRDRLAEAQAGTGAVVDGKLQQLAARGVLAREEIDGSGGAIGGRPELRLDHAVLVAGQLGPAAVGRAQVVLELAAVALLHAGERQALGRRLDDDLRYLGEVLPQFVGVLFGRRAQDVAVDLHVELVVGLRPLVPPGVARVVEGLRVGRPGERAARRAVLGMRDHLEDLPAGGGVEEVHVARLAATLGERDRDEPPVVARDVPVDRRCALRIQRIGVHQDPGALRMVG